MASSENRNDHEPSVMIHARKYVSKKSGNPYVMINTVDLDELKSELGRYVNARVVISSKSDDKDERLVFFSPSEARYINKKDSGSKSHGGSNGGRRNNSGTVDDYDDVIV